MPYQDIRALPNRVANYLPKHTQEIFLAAFNHAFEEYGRDEKLAFRFAWSAVERNFEKGEDGERQKKHE